MIVIEEDIWKCVERLSALSNCKDRQVGCIIYNTKLNEIVSRGWNTHTDSNCDCSTTKTAVHAENMAITSLPQPYDREDLVLFVNHAPCSNCKSLIETRVNEVRYKSQK